jgi:hypothetical protein
VVALTDVDALHEVEAFLERSVRATSSGGAPAHPVSDRETDEAKG